MSENYGRHPDFGDEEYIICLWDSISNQVRKVHGCEDLEEAKKWVHRHYIIDNGWPNRVDIVGKSGLSASFHVKGDRTKPQKRITANYRNEIEANAYVEGLLYADNQFIKDVRVDFEEDTNLFVASFFDERVEI